MPITLTIPEGALSAEAEAQAFAGLTEALLKIARLRGNAFMERTIVGTINVLPASRVFSAGKPLAAAFIELKLPTIALATDEAMQAFVAEATDIVERAAAGRIARDDIWTNVVYVAEGSWGIGGRCYRNADLIDAIQNAA